MLFIFDWDGTLCSSLDRIVASVQYSAKDLGIEVPPTGKIRGIIGLGLAEALAELFPGVPLTEQNQLIERYRHYFVALEGQVPTPLYEDVLHTLDQLREAGHLLAVATGKARVGLDRALTEQGLSDFFDASRCADETRSKPHPLMLEQLLDELECEADKALMIGDTEFDLMMAKAAGVQAVGVTYGAHPVSRLEKCQPHLLLDNLSTILQHY